MDKNFIKKFFLGFAETGLLVGIVLFAVIPVSCKVTTQGIQMIGGNYRVPSLENLTVINEQQVQIDFSKEVLVSDVIVSPFIEEESDSYEISMTQDLSTALSCAAGKYGKLEYELLSVNDNKSVVINLKESTKIGKQYEVYGKVSDKTGNTLVFVIPFKGFNSAVPEIVMTEIHPAMASQLKSEESKGTRRLEYVECKALSDGNLAGLILASGYAGESKAYCFPAVEVKKGESFIVHLRTWGEGCISEEGEDLTLAFSDYTSPFYRDLWSEETSKPMDDKNDILVIKNSVTNKIIDAVMYSNYSIESWESHLKTDYTCEPDFCDFYEDCSVSAAVSSSGVGSSKVLKRDVSKNTWSISESSHNPSKS